MGEHQSGDPSKRVVQVTSYDGSEREAMIDWHETNLLLAWM